MVVGSNPTTGATIILPPFSEKFLRATQSVAHCFEGISSTFLFRKDRFEPKIFWRDDFLEGRSSFFAIPSSKEASFIHSRIGSSQTPDPYFKSSFSSPLKSMQITGLDFGEFLEGKDYQLQHFGVDLKAALGTKIYAVNDGKVVLVKDLANYGKTVVIDHGLGIFSLYLHLSEYMVSENQDVKNGQVIGLSGNSGYSSAPHLHFSIRDNKARVNPISFIKTTQEANDNFNLANIGRAFLKIFNN